ncbi:MAG: winged helix-turn-helix domain-containing tetratricopeptide repeat protein [Halocynthiibacter sp.]
MRYQFGEFELDTLRAELRDGAGEIAIEPKIYALLCLLVGNHDRLVPKDEVIEKVWDGRFVSEAVISTGIKSVRRALGDDGEAQKFVKTIRGRGFRFVAAVRITSGADVAAQPGQDQAAQTDAAVAAGKPSLAILPFGLVGYSQKYSAIADAVPSELISSLSRLRWLSVVARGSTFRFRGAGVDLSVINSLLGANYCLSGVVEIFGSDLTLSVELADTRNQVVVWSDRFKSKIDDIHDTRSQIVASTISALEIYIPLREAELARVRSPESLDAWSVYHVGMQHMYRFNRVDNEIAAGHFRRATEIDPYFARAFAARSFTSFQKAFLKNSVDVEHDKKDTRRFAEKCLELDPMDPFGNFTLGRSYWLEGEPDAGIDWLERAVALNPNYAQGIYAHGWADVMACRGREAGIYLDKAIALSPLDPFHYAMLSSRGMAHALQGDFEKAAVWADRGARAPGAHFLISAIAAAAHQFNNNPKMAAYWMKNVRSRRSDASLGHFFTAFPFADQGVRDKWSKALLSSGL